MKSIDDMTLNETRELKERYKDEFRTLVREFLKKHPEIRYIWIYRVTRFGVDGIILKDDNLGVIDDVALKGEKI